MRFITKTYRSSIRGKRRLIVALPFAVLLWTTSVAQGAVIHGGGGGLTDATSNPSPPNLYGGYLVSEDQQFGAVTIDSVTAGLVDYSSYTVSPTSGSTSMTFTDTESELLTALVTGPYTIETGILGTFSSSLPTSNVVVTTYSVTSTLYTDSGGGLGTEMGSSKAGANYDGGLSTTPVTLYNYAASGLVNLVGGTNYWMEQVLTVELTNLSEGNQISFNFPNQSDIDPVSEPASLTLFGIGACVVMGCGWRRRRLNPRIP